METSVKAYGKILVFGAYSILEQGNLGLVVNINKGTTTTAQEIESGRIYINLDKFEISIFVNVDGKVKPIKDKHLLTLVKNAVEFSYKFLNDRRYKLRDVKLINTTDPHLYLKKKLKTGFGSSATTTVSTVATVMLLHAMEDRDLIYKISQYSHYVSQGLVGSGFDIAAACYGSHYFVSNPFPYSSDFISCVKQDWPVNRQSFEWPQYFLPVLIFTGKSASTSKLVAKVAEFKRKHLFEYQQFMKEYNQINILAGQAFVENSADKIKDSLEKSWLKRKELGKLVGAKIEEDKYTRLAEDCKQHGAFFAGLTGAGGGDSMLAVSTSREEKMRLVDYLEKKKYYVLEDIKIASSPYEILE